MTSSSPRPEVGEDGDPRCPWALSAPDFPAYHDAEWGFPVDDDRRLFEKISLEGFQAGLSWRTILTKRPAFRAGFANFEPEAVAAFGPADVERLLADAGIVRHRGKIEAVIGNAAAYLELVEREGSLAAYLWRFEPTLAELGEPQTITTCPSSIALSKDLKRRGWRFVGPTTMFALMESMGLINNHVPGCVVRERALAARAAFTPPVPTSR
ncbi:DNA-3-methyladenine glycosylase I [Nocardioides sp.]|uniref:DNA-3-methyladenine glycosylase I n=1 Tax=Nocardioides sp. TaxID=35761 RepID=UPI003515DABE